jgi:hypothetical protein
VPKGNCRYTATHLATKHHHNNSQQKQQQQQQHEPQKNNDNNGKNYAKDSKRPFVCRPHQRWSPQHTTDAPYNRTIIEFTQANKNLQAGWNTNPWLLTGVNGYLYARGATDDKVGAPMNSFPMMCVRSLSLLVRLPLHCSHQSQRAYFCALSLCASLHRSHRLQSAYFCTRSDDLSFCAYLCTALIDRKRRCH